MTDEYSRGTASSPYATISSTGSLMPNTIYVSLLESVDGLHWSINMAGDDIAFSNGETTIKFSKEFLKVFKDALDMVSEINWEQEIEE